MLNIDEKRLLVKICKLYYFEEWTQAEIAKKIGVSRPIISKLLQKAKEKGIVEIIIHDDTDRPIDLEQRLEKEFGLNDVLIVSTQGLTEEMIKSTVGKAAAQYLSKNLKQAQKIGISWGSTLYHMVMEYPVENRLEVKVIPLVGGMGAGRIEIHSNQLAYELSKKLNGKCESLYAPAIVETEELKEQLIQTPHIASVLEEGSQVDIAIVGIGTPYQHSTMQEIGYLQQEEIDDLKAIGVVGDISSRFIDAEGRIADHSLNNKVIGVELEQLKKTDKVIGVAIGLHKVEAILATLKGNYIDVLITDDQTAGALDKKLRHIKNEE